jgi:hypothetical protein
VRSLATALLVAFAVPSLVEAQPCEPAFVEVGEGAGGDAERAVEDIRSASAQVGRPWACRGGVVTVERTADGFGVTVSRGATARVRRVVATSTELVPLALALLSLPDLPDHGIEEVPSVPPEALPPPLEAPADRAAAPTPTPATAKPEPPSATADTSTRVELRLLADFRVAVPNDVLLLGPQLGVAFPFEVPRWLVLGGWLRLGAPLATLERGPAIGEADAGVTVGARFEAGPVELRVDLGLGGAVLFRDLPRPEGSQVLGAPRALTRFCGAAPTGFPVRALFCVGADGTIPISDERARGSAPIFAAGSSAGVEWAP